MIFNDWKIKKVSRRITMRGLGLGYGQGFFFIYNIDFDIILLF